MIRTEIEEKVKNFLIEELEIDEENIFPEAKLKDDMGIDSLDYVDIVVIVERNFGFMIKAEEMIGVDTFTKFCVFSPALCSKYSIAKYVMNKNGITFNVSNKVCSIT